MYPTQKFEFSLETSTHIKRALWFDRIRVPPKVTHKVKRDDPSKGVLSFYRYCQGPDWNVSVWCGESLS